MDLVGFLALVVVAAAILLVVRGWDVRLVLLAAALVIAAMSGDVSRVPREFLATFSNEKFVVPICTAMGFAYVLRHTGCERHLVLLLVRPLRRMRWLLVPGVIAVGFLVNIPVISQTSTAVCIGPVVVPLMRAAGYSMPTIGACLLLGASVGGELLNPGAPELLTVYAANPDHPRSSTTAQAQEYLPPLVFTQLAVSMTVFWALSVWWERKTPSDLSPNLLPQRETGLSSPPSLVGKGDGGLGLAASERINILKALVPLVPIALLFASGPPLNLITIPQHWVVPRPPEAPSAAAVGYPATIAMEAKKHSSFNTRLIGFAMLVGVVIAAAVTPSKARDCVKQFFEGAGYGFTHIISLIVVANCFGKAIETAGLAEALGQLITGAPRLMQPLAAFVPLTFAAVSGSGMASTQSLYHFFQEPALDLGLDPVAIGSMVSLGAAAGRTMSPVAAVTLMCATLTGANPFTLAKRVAGPLLVGIIVVIVLRMSGVL